MSERTNEIDREAKAHSHTASMYVSEESGHVRVSLWVEAWRKKIAQRDAVVVRYADDGVVGFECREDAERLLVDLQTRYRQFGLEVHPDKTCLIELRPHALANRKQRGEGKPETFDFLGFAPICERHQKTGYFIVDVRRHANGPAAGGECARLLRLPMQCQATCPS